MDAVGEGPVVVILRVGDNAGVARLGPMEAAVVPAVAGQHDPPELGRPGQDEGVGNALVGPAVVPGGEDIMPNTRRASATGMGTFSSA